MSRDDVAGQVRQCLNNLGVVAVAVGSNLRKFGLRLTVYVADLDRDWMTINEAYADWFGTVRFPARVTFGVARALRTWPTVSWE